MLLAASGGESRSRYDHRVSEEASTEEPAVLTEQRGRILIITINRPKAKNAVNAAVSNDLAAAMDKLDDDPGLSVGIVTGAGGSFCAGWISRPSPAARTSWPRAAAWASPSGHRPSRRSPPWRATRWQAARSWRWPPTSSWPPRIPRSAFRRSSAGWSPAAAGCCDCRSASPYQIAMEPALTGENLPAERAHELGLVNVLAEPGHARRRRSGWPSGSRQRPARGGRHQADHHRGAGWSPEDQWKNQAKIMMPVFGSNDAKGGRDRVRREAGAELDRQLSRLAAVVSRR